MNHDDDKTDQVGLSADLEQDERRRESKSRPAGEPEPISGPVEDALVALARAKDAYDRKRLRVIDQDCPTCKDPDAPLARFCSFRGEQVCHHTEELALRGKRKTLEANLRSAKVPEAHWSAILRNDIDALAPVAAVRRALAGEKNLIVLAGTPDSGKSFAAAMAVAARGGFWVNAETFDQYANKIDTLLNHCREVPLLAIDDVGAGRSTSEVAAPQIEGLVRERFDRDRLTILTTNLSEAKFWPFYGGPVGRMANRVGENGWIHCLDKARRRNGRGEK